MEIKSKIAPIFPTLFISELDFLRIYHRGSEDNKPLSFIQ